MSTFIVFYDDTCGLCTYAIRFLVRFDKKKRIFIAPLSGKTAARELQDWRPMHPFLDSIVLLIQHSAQKNEIYIWSKAIFRLLWFIGGFWKLIGLFSFLPQPFLYPFDAIYRCIAQHRKELCALPEPIEKRDERFLP